MNAYGDDTSRPRPLDPVAYASLSEAQQQAAARLREVEELLPELADDGHDEPWWRDLLRALEADLHRVAHDRRRPREDGTCQMP